MFLTAHPSQSKTLSLSPFTKTIDGLVRYSSPVLADLNNDGHQEIIVGTEQGYVVAMQYSADGTFTLLWQTFLGSALGSSPSVGDVNGDGKLEIAIGVGWFPTDQSGSVVLLDHNGSVLWHRQTGDRNGGSDGIPDGVFGTPALGDLNNNGYLEIVVAGFDENLYVFDYEGNDLPGFPFWLQDGTWGTPGLGDFDKDGHLDIVIGAFANQHATECPDYSCGRIFMLNHRGDSLRGWPVLVDGHIDSSPAIADINNDGALEFVIGTGQSSQLADRFNKVYAFQADGQMMPGWPQTSGGFVFSSPSVADTDGNGTYEIFVGSADQQDVISGTIQGNHYLDEPVTPINQNGNPQSLSTAASPTIVDADGDGQLEVFIPSGWDIVGFELSGTPLSDNYRLMTNYSIGSTPIWGDITGNGYLEVVIANAHHIDVRSKFWSN